MFFLYTIGFLAAAGIIVPLIIHLWNVKEGKTLKIGSIILLGETARKSAKSFKIKDWLLLLLRCFLILLIAFLLAQPYLKINENLKSKLGWVLFDTNKFKGLNALQKKEIEDLSKKGFELHGLSVGFPIISIEDSLSFSDKKTTKFPVFSLINELNSRFPNGFKTIIYTDKSIHNFKGELPKIHLKLEFRDIRLKDNSIQKVASAFIDNSDNIKILLMKSDDYNTNYQLINYVVNDKNFDFKTEQGENFIKFKGQQNWVKVDDKPIKVAVYADAKQDAEYLNAALKAIAIFTQRKILIIKINQSELISPNYDWIFWLSEKTFNQKTEPKTRIFSYQKGKTENLNSFLFTSTSTKNKIFKRIDFQNNQEAIIWKDGYGNPILSTQKESVLNYRFYSRLNPQWTDLVWSGNFAKEMLPILFTNPIDISVDGFKYDIDDQRQISKNQSLSYFGQSYHDKADISGLTRSLDKWFWLAAFFIFAIERVITYYQKSNG